LFLTVLKYTYIIWEAAENLFRLVHRRLGQV